MLWIKKEVHFKYNFLKKSCFELGEKNYIDHFNILFLISAFEFYPHHYTANFLKICSYLINFKRKWSCLIAVLLSETFWKENMKVLNTIPLFRFSISYKIINLL